MRVTGCEPPGSGRGSLRAPARACPGRGVLGARPCTSGWSPAQPRPLGEAEWLCRASREAASRTRHPPVPGAPPREPRPCGRRAPSHPPSRLRPRSGPRARGSQSTAPCAGRLGRRFQVAPVSGCGRGRPHGTAPRGGALGSGLVAVAGRAAGQDPGLHSPLVRRCGGASTMPNPVGDTVTKATLLPSRRAPSRPRWQDHGADKRAVLELRPRQHVRGSWGTGTPASSRGAAGERSLAESSASAGPEGRRVPRVWNAGVTRWGWRRAGLEREVLSRRL